MLLPGFIPEEHDGGKADQCCDDSEENIVIRSKVGLDCSTAHGRHPFDLLFHEDLFAYRIASLIANVNPNTYFLIACLKTKNEFRYEYDETYY